MSSAHIPPEGNKTFGEVLREERRRLDWAPRRRADWEQRFLAEADKVLADSFDFDKLLAWVTRLVVPDLGDWCVLSFVRRDESPCVAVAHAEPAMATWSRRVEDWHLADLKAKGAVAGASARSVVVASAENEGALAALAPEADLADLYRLGGLRSYILVPLAGRGRRFGSLLLASAESGRRYTVSDQSLANELATRCAIALDNADHLGAVEEELRKRDAALETVRREVGEPLKAVGTFLERLLETWRQSPGDDRALESAMEGGDAIAERVHRLEQEMETLTHPGRH